MGISQSILLNKAERKLTGHRVNFSWLFRLSQRTNYVTKIANRYLYHTSVNKLLEACSNVVSCYCFGGGAFARLEVVKQLFGN